MKKLTLILLAVGCSISMIAQEASEYILTIKSLKAKTTDKVYIYFQDNNQMKMDSFPLIKGHCEIKGKIVDTAPGYVYIEPANSNFGKRPNSKPGDIVYLEKGNILMEFRDGDKDPVISGTKTNNDYTEMVKRLLPFQQKESQMEALFKEAKAKNDEAMMERLKLDYQNMLKDRNVVEKAFFDTHLDSEVSLDWLSTSVDVANHKKEATTLFNSLSERLRNTRNGKRYSAKLASVTSVDINDMAPAFSANAATGEQISLSSYKGKYVLLDFWASWCVPCRRENPNVVAVYQKYKSDKFDILGFSLDNSKDAWLKAIEKDGLTWKHVSDLGGWQSEVAYNYAVRAIPANFLIDPSGKIIAKNLQGEELEKKLNEIFKK